MEITFNPSTWPAGDKSWTLAHAIALAEGANIEGDVPDRYNNPGDISDYAEEYGSGLHDGSYVTTFPTKVIGWAALHQKLENIRLCVSEVYHPGWTFERLGQTWAGNSTTWSANVAKILGVTVQSTLKEFWES